MNKKELSAASILEEMMQKIVPLPSQMAYANDLAAIFSMHIHRNQLMDQGYTADELPMPTAIVVAPTGQGKTYLVRKMAESCGIHFICVDCSTLVSEGYKGVSLSQRLAGARDTAKDQRAYERSILFLDEVDKLCTWGNNYGNGMTNLLQLFNGGQIAVDSDSKKAQYIDVSRFTILLGGAFEGIEKIVQNRICPKAKIGFQDQKEAEIKNPAKLLSHVELEDLKEYGLMPELLGRVGTIMTIPPLEREDYRRLLCSDTGSIRRKYNNYLSLYGVTMDIMPLCVEKVAQMCINAKTGARAVNPLVDGLMRWAILNVENDGRINSVVLDVEGEELCVRYQYGARKRYRSEQGQKTKKEQKVHIVKAKSIPALVRKLCRYYRNTDGDPETMAQLEAFLGCAIVYLRYECSADDFKFESLEKLADITNREQEKAPFDETVCRSFFVPKDKRLAYERVYTNWTRQNLLSALETILEYIWEHHGECDVCFQLPKGK